MSKANRKGRARRSDKNGAHSRQNKPTRPRIPLRFRCEELEPRRLLSIPGFTGLPEWTTISEPVLENGNTIIPDQHSPVSGAVNAIVASPTDPNTVFAATINGGIWVTHNALATDTFSEGKPAWTPLTDRFPSLSFGAIAFDPTDPTNKTLWAGFGQFSNGAGDGEAPLGLLKTTNGGGTWAPMAVGSLSGQNVESIVPTTQIDPTTNQQVILVATQGGTWRSNNGGNSFTNLSATAAAGLPVGAAPSQLIVDPANANQFYVAIPNLGIYRSTNNRGAQWVPVNTGLKDSSGNSGVAGSINARLSIYNSGGINAVYAGFVYPAPASPPKSNDPTVVFRSTNAGGNWTQIGGNVVVHPGNNQANNFALIADRNNANAVYIAGDSQASSPFDANIVRGDASTNSWNSVVDGGANNTSPHADARDFSWDANGDLFFASDGGVYRMINVGTSGQKWQAAVGTMDVHEIYSVGYIPGAGFVFGTQDTGTAEPQIPNPQQSTFTYQNINSGDGNVVAVDSTSNPGTTYVYTSGNSFFTFQVQAFDGSYHQISKTNVALTVNTSSPTVHVIDRTGTTFTFDTTLPFVPPYLLNTVDPTRMLIGSNWLYESTDRGSTVNLLNGPLVGNLPDPTKSTGQIVPLVYGGVSGGVGNTSVIYAASGANFAKLYVRTAGTGMPTQVTYPSNLGGFALAGIRAGAVDPTNYNTAFMADANGRISKTTDAGATLGNWSDVTGDLPNLTTDLRTLTTYRNGSKLYLFVGGAGGVYFADMTGPTYHWRKFGNFLPSVIVKDLHYNAAGDFLYAGTWGRGVWSVSKVSTLLPATPTTLTITGDTGANPNDVFTVSADPNIPNIINVKFDNGTNAYTYAVDAAAIDSIKIMGGAGTDAYNIQNTGLTVPVSIDIGSATASIRVFGATGVNSNTNGAVTITGGTGTATLAVDEQGNTFIGGTINVSTATAGGGITGPTTGNVTYDGTLHLTSATLFTTAGGGQSVNITATGVPTNINPGRTAPASNSDFIFIGTSNSVQSIAGAISIEDLGNFDSIYLNDQADLSTPAITIDQYTPAGNTAFGRIAGLSPAAISFKLSDLYEVGVRTGISLNAIYLRGPGSLIDPTWQAVIQSQPKVTVQNMTLIHGVIATAAPSFQALNNTLGDSQIVGGTGARLDNNQLTNLAVSGNAVQVTITNNHVSGGVSLTNATNVLFQGNTITGALTATGVSSLQATGNTIGSATLTGTTSATLTSNTVTGAVVLSGGSGNHLDTNTLGSLNLTGGTDGAVINNNSIFGTLSITGGGATNVTIQNNRAGAYDEQAAATGTITGNDFGWNGVGGGAAPGARSLGAAMVSVTFNLNGQFTGSIDHNDIHNGVIGLNYLFPSAFVSNHIFNNATGVIMPVNDTVNGLGFFPGSGANDIYNNTIGVNLTGRMQLQHVYSNTTGVVGSGILGGNSLDTANLIETNITGVDFTGRIQFNRIDSNTTAIITHTGQIVVHNLIYRNTGAGVRTNGANDVRIVNNTFYSTAGNNVQVDGGSSRTELLDNIFQADGGYDVFVADNSRTGFFSDYNDLYSTGPGKLLHYFTDFSDIIDIQRDLGLFDLHSIGTSAVNPGYAQPRFANPATNDFHITALAAGSHASSPTIDAADPLTDLLLPSAYQNLLANPSFDSGTNSWTVNTGGSTLSANPAAFNGSSYFYSGAVGAGFAEQTVSLTPGFTPAQLDAQNLSVVFGGRIRSAPESPTDQGKLILTFLNGVGNPIGAPDIVPATNATDRWELAGDRLHVPVGARSVKYRFETLRLSGATDDSYLDGAALYVLPDSVAPDQGAYGNTDAGDINLAAAHVQLITPQLYVDWQPNQPHTISWTTFNGGGSPVRIDVYQDVAGVPQLLTNITASTPDTGSFTWIPQNSGLTYGTFGLRIKVSLVSTPSASDLSNEVFAIPENTHTYYVNDGSTTGDQYTTAIGSNRNTGRLPSEPKPLLSTLFAAYSLGAADTIYVDTGTYQHIGSILISGNPAIGNGQGVTITGPTNGGAVAQISSPSVGPTFDINAGNFVTISHLAFSGGQYGVWVHGGSSNFTGSFLTTSGNTLDGVRLEANSSASAALDHLVSFSNGRDGISVGGPGVNLSNSVAHHNAGAGIRYDNAGNAVITASQGSFNQYGLVITNNINGTTAVVGAVNLSLNQGNLFHDNATNGVYATGYVNLAGNTVYGTATPGGVGPAQLTLGPDPGIYLSSSTSYTYVVTAITATGETAPSPEQTIVLPASGSHGVSLSWAAVPGALSYKVYRGSPGAERLVAGGILGVSYLDTGAVFAGTPLPGANTSGVSLLSGASATENVVYFNYLGIYSNGGAVTNNRVFNNSGTGIYAASSANATGNVSYSNAVGIEGDGSPTWSNNLLYADAVAGLWLHGGFAASLFNNTVYLPAGDGIRIESTGGNFGFQHVNVRNNIVWTQGGYGITVTPQSEIGFQSDYNDFFTTGSGKVGFWEGAARASLSAWHLAGFTDGNSLSQNPAFVSPAGADGLLGFGNSADHGSDDDFHEQSTVGSFHGGALAPVVNAATGLPVFPAATLTADASTSPAVDRGDPASSFANEPAPSGGFINLGTFGNTNQASETFIPYVQVLRPNGGETVVEGQTASLSWRSEDTAGTANIDLLNGNAVALNIATGVPNSGSYAWSVPTSITPGGNYFIRVTRNSPLAAGQSAAPFSILGPTHTFYVNDGSFQPGDFTTAPGDDANSGLDPAHPKASIRALLDAYSLGAGDVIDVDSGTYTPSSNIVLPAGRSGVTIRGFAADSFRPAVINRGSAAAGSYVFELQGATNVTLDHLSITGGQIGVYAGDNAGSTGLTVSNCDLYANADYNVYLGPANGGATITGSRVHDTNGFNKVGIYARQSQVTVTNNSVYNNPRYGIDVEAGNNSTISGNMVFANGTGIIADTAAVSGNIAYGNPSAGIQVSGNCTVTGNTTYNNFGPSGSPQAGIFAYGGTVQGNVSFGNRYGVFVSGTATVANNLLNNNSVAGVYAGGGSAVSGNVVYGNGVGIEGDSSPTYANNLVHDNATAGIWLHGGVAAQILNNTVYQPAGDGVRIESTEFNLGFQHVKFENNLVWAQAGYDLTLTPNSVYGFVSDYNDLYTSGTGRVGLWQNVARNTLSDWQLAGLQDANSLWADPLFVNAAGFDFHEQSLYGSFHGGSLAPIYNPNSGLPATATPTLVVDASQSPAIDRGDPASPFVNEPALSGGYINLGAFGNTAQASRSPAAYLFVTKPAGGESWIEGQSFNIQWRDNSIGTGLVDIDLLTQSGGGPVLQSHIVTGAANNGRYAWNLPGSIPPGSNYLVRVTVEGSAVAGISPAVFAIAAQTHVFYVNDGSVQAGDWTSAIGDDTSSGADPAHPKASITGVLSSYTLVPGDTIRVDAGTYNLNGDIVLAAAQSGITIVGYNDPAFPARKAVLDRGNKSSGAVFRTNGAANLTLDHLALTDAANAFTSTYQVASNNTTLSDCEIYGNGGYAVYLIGGADNFTLTRCLIHDNDQGVSAQYLSNLTVTDNTIYNARGRGISITSAGGTITGNDVSGISGVAIEAYGSLGTLITLANNHSHDSGQGIIVGSYVLATGNTANNISNFNIGIQVAGGEARGNLSYNNYIGIYVSSGLADLNRTYNNSSLGMFVGSGATATFNAVYSNPTGIRGDFSPTISNNLVYANSVRGIWITSGVAAQVINNTVYQPAGNAVELLSSEGNFQFQRMLVSNNLLWAQAGYDLLLSDHAAIGFQSDYNDLVVTAGGKAARISNRDYPALSDWTLEYGFDAHSISADPQFVSPAGGDGLLGYSGGVDHGSDDNFHLQSTSPAIDAGNPNSNFFNEPAPSGGRINLGHLGNTPQADVSPAAQSVQITYPDNFQKLEAGHPYSLSWRTAGVSAAQPVFMIDSGGAGVGPWTPDAFGGTGVSTRTPTNTIDTSGVVNPAPQSVYQSYVYSGGTGLSYRLPVPNGSYTLRLHFMDEVVNIGKPVFDIKVNGMVVQSHYDLFADAGGAYKATALSFNVAASGGTGLLVELVPVSGLAVLSALELAAANPSPVPSPTANLQVSTDNGVNWTTIATNQPLDVYGRGTFQWTPALTTNGPTARFRVLINNTALSATSGPFGVYNGGTDYYVNDSSQAGDVLTSAIGNNANSGKSPDSPLADLQAVLAQYNPGPGAVIHVDAGHYVLVHDLYLSAANSGLVIRGAPGAAAVVDRANGNDPAFVFTAAANNITLDQLTITGGSAGVFADYGTNATGDTVSGSQIQGNAYYGVLLGSGDNGWTITGNSIHDNRNINSGLARGIDVENAQVTISNNKVFNEPQFGIYVANNSSGSTISGNETYADGVGIQVNNVTVAGNQVHDNATAGINATSSLVSGNTVYRQTALNAAGILLAYSEARGNAVYYNYNGIVTATGTNTIDRNRVYSNINFGISFPGSTGFVFDNLVYANSAAGIVLTGSGGVQVANNTVYQGVGDALRLVSSPNAAVRGNLLWVEAGNDLSVSADSQGGFVSDYNDLYRGAGASARVGSWGGASADPLSNWQAASAQDAHSLSADPGFLNLKGADQVLGYSAAGNGYDGGADDNFYLSAGSPAIDRGYSWPAYNTDLLGAPHVNDPGTPDAGSPVYSPADPGSSLYALSGTAKGWRSNNTYFNFTLPFAFPFYASSYTTVSVSTEGFLQFAGPDYAGDNANSDASLLRNARIAPLWDNLLTSGPGNDISVDTSVAGQVKFTWVATNEANNSAVAFSAVLFSDGRIRFDYGAGNASLTPTVGLSMGDGLHATFLPYDNAASLTNAHSILLGFTPGAVDMGAYEFQGSSSDHVPPTVTAVTPAGIATGGPVASFPQITLTFSKALNAIDAAAAGNYQLLGAGPDGLFGTADDMVFALTPVYAGGSTQVTLTVSGGLVPAGKYRLTAYASAGAVLHDLSGNALAGDGANAGTNYVAVFTATAPAPSVAPFALAPAPEGAATSPVSGSFSGQAGDAFTATVDYGDGTGVQPLPLNGNSFTLSHAYAEGGSYTVTVVVTDTTTGLVSVPASTGVAISDVAVLASISGNPAGPIAAGTAVNLSFTVSNPNPLEMGPLLVAWTVTGPAGFTTLSGSGPTASFTPTLAGTYTVSLSAGESATPDAETGTATASFTVTPAAPTLVSRTIDAGTGQRSLVRSLTFTFSSPVTLSAGAITLWQVQNLSGPTGLDASAALGVPTSADGGLTWKVPVSAASAFSALGSLLDGVYQTTVHANLVTDSFNQHLSGGDQTGLKFHRLFGDLNGDKRVNAGDYLAFSNAFGSTSPSANYNASFDFNHDGRVNSGDYLQFSNRFGKAFAYSG